jgi:hypothetical protein
MMLAFNNHVKGIDDSDRSTSRRAPASKPLPLKQRTSSVDTRRDYSLHTVFSSLSLLKVREYFLTVDNFSIWRRHLAWAMENGADLRAYMTQRFASSMVFMSLLLGAELNVLFNSAAVTTSMRRELFSENFWKIEFWAGITILISVILTILSLFSTFTVWGMVSSISDANAHCILRSSIGQYVSELPGRFIVSAVYSFLIWVSLFFFLLLPVGFWSILLLVITAALFFHVVVVFSAFGRIIMHSGAMGTNRIFDEQTEKSLLPHTLHSSLLEKAREVLASKTSIMRQYKRKRTTTVGSSSIGTDFSSMEPRKRADSSVRFADTLWTTNAPLREPATSTCLSDIADGTETPSSQVSVASSSDRMERPKRPPRPAAVSSSHSGGFLDALGGSSHSLEEWLKASGTNEDTKTNSSKNHERASLSDAGHAFHASAGTVTKKPRKDGTSNPMPPRDGRRRSISPIDSEAFDAGSVGNDQGHRFSQHPSLLHTRNPPSDDSIANPRELTDEEKFDEEYGELFDVQRNGTVDSQGYEVEFGHEDSDLELSGQAAEEQRLLPGGDGRVTRYDAVKTDNQEKSDPRPS